MNFLFILKRTMICPDCGNKLIKRKSHIVVKRTFLGKKYCEYWFRLECSNCYFDKMFYEKEKYINEDKYSWEL
jgi:hypothetical protein